ncbi:hypothetical protein U9M48_029209 [Paspalum notatum var. saurae]|uniref:Uncharacterized protein n=1 Tax=Paspalum notatum var. saurae TaxID=547442 RepID=A0AAQ3TYD8_PASNO
MLRWGPPVQRAAHVCPARRPQPPSAASSPPPPAHGREDAGGERTRAGEGVAEAKFCVGPLHEEALGERVAKRRCERQATERRVR